MRHDPKISLELTASEAASLSHLVKRLLRNELGPVSSGGLDLVTPNDALDTDVALTKLRGALDDAGFSVR